MGTPLYDEIGHGYAAYRTPDPRIAAFLGQALGDARRVVNVGAGTGSYEPTDRHVVAVEPSDVMAAQRPEPLPPAVRATAEALPFADASFDAAMAVLSLHHFADPRAGLQEMRRVAARIVLLTFDMDVAAGTWLYQDHFPHRTAEHRAQFPTMTDLRAWLGPRTEVVSVPVPRDCRDGFVLAYWGRPEGLLDAGARAAISGFATMDDAEEARIVDALEHDLRSGAWDERHGALRELDALDVGLRLVAA